MARYAAGRRMRRTIARIGAKRARYARRRLSRRAGSRRIRQPVQYFKRSAWKAAGIVATATPTSDPFKWNFIFSLTDCPNYSEFTAIYDQYQIKAVKVTLFPKFTQSDGASFANPNSNNLPDVMSILDYDGGVPVNYGISDLMQYQNLKVTRGNRMHSRYMKPRIQTMVYNGVTSTAYAPKKNQWLDCDQAAVPHYGLYGLVDMTTVATETRVVYDVKVDYYLAFKNVK